MTLWKICFLSGGRWIWAVEFVLSNYQLDFEKDEAEGFWQYRIEGSKDGENFDVLEDKTESESGIVRKQVH